MSTPVTTLSIPSTTSSHPNPFKETHELTLQMLENGHIPARLVHTIKSVINPICTSIEPLPVFGDLRYFWENTEEGLKSLGREIRVSKLKGVHIRSLVRFILGPAT